MTWYDHRLNRLPVADIELPRELRRLYDLAYNLWWSWTPAAQDLFARIDRESWARYRNPVELLINVEPHQWAPLLEDELFMDSYHELVGRLDHYRGEEDSTWFRDRVEGDEDAPTMDPIAYFSMEFGIDTSLALYSGGLGVLSGDHLKSASDLGLPMVALGLLYRRGYFLSCDLPGTCRKSK